MYYISISKSIHIYIYILLISICNTFFFLGTPGGAALGGRPHRARVVYLSVYLSMSLSISISISTYI